MSLVSYGEFLHSTGEIEHENFCVVNTTGMYEFSVIFEAFDADNNPVNFNNQKYSIFVGHNTWDIPYDRYDYEHVMLGKKENWIHLRDVSLGNDVHCDNSFNNLNAGIYAAAVHFKYVMFVTPEIPNVKV